MEGGAGAVPFPGGGQAVHGVSKKAVQLHRHHVSGLAGAQRLNQPAPFGASIQRLGAADALLTEDGHELQARHHAISLNSFQLGIQTAALVGLLGGADP